MFGMNEKKSPWSIANSIAEEIGRRGFPAEAKPLPVMSATGSIQSYAIVIPGRGVAAINNNLNVVVVSSNKPLPKSPVFEYESAESAAENILRNLPPS